MKKLLGIVIVFCLMSSFSMAQSAKPTKIYFYNGVINFGTIDLKVTADVNKPISVKQRSWVILDMVGDSLGFFVNDKPFFVHFEQGKSYYFIARRNHASNVTFVTEESERSFIMTVSVNSAKGPEEYKLGKLAN